MLVSPLGPVAVRIWYVIGCSIVPVITYALPVMFTERSLTLQLNDRVTPKPLGCAPPRVIEPLYPNAATTESQRSTSSSAGTWMSGSFIGAAAPPCADACSVAPSAEPRPAAAG